ncbi:MAG: SDR family oxidoreductase [Syntrophorhabdus sp.]|jgi:NAD(P)-dependent dehydrogenase (short-subunit alcohol dehydrogenase family)|nr:SDR family oxidoreductase [Syntrophorhabdus sp.]MDI9559036.1 SDR family oxidoreductase [Pseudomonadota bacterium]OPX93384.1 MAG: (S)-1-Phenylethanol dehydrogenase [Syntrophorhabdus sp. PtaB.Bin027]OQB77067.1 MAG: (S)-1-Phenylethanol dehydrogenase [Deltaproteobacteria bacterium ADurb.Bin135]NMC94104.1 SDR family oxidoreductase [Syntrophorhabdus sp.]
MRLKDKIAIITGASQGIGAAFAAGFAKEGAKIVIADISDGAKTVKKVADAGSEALFVKTDVSKEPECMAMAKAAYDKFGSIDILINNAAVFANIVLKPFTELSSEEFKKVIEINTSGVFHCIKAVFPYMKEKGGKIVNISSASILEGIPGMPHYVASKGAVMALTRCMARELGDFRINVNTIAPGFTHSEGGDQFDRGKALPLPPLDELQLQGRCIKRPSMPEDLVGLALFLSTNDSAFITGQMIVHDGGLSLH